MVASKWVGSTDRLAYLLNQVRLDASSDATGQECQAMIAEGWIRLLANGWYDLTPKGRETLYTAERPYRHTCTD